MPKLQTFDGTELDAVLAEVRREAGPDAKITAASKVRSGGLGGFFSKEVFRVTVALPEPDVAGDLRHAPVAPLAFEPLTAPRVAEDPLGPPMSLLELADLVDEAEAEATSEARRAPEPEPAPAPVAAPPEPVPTPAPPAAVVPTVRPEPYTPSTEGASFNAVLRRLASDAELALDHDDRPLPAPAPARHLVPAPRRISLPAMPELGPEISSTLAGLGIPDDLLPTDITPAAAVIAMLHSLRLPAAPELPREPGALTVVLGDRKGALALAHDLAAELGLKRGDVKIADPEAKGKATQLARPEQIAEQRGQWTPGPKVLAMSSGPSRHERGWAWEMLAELAPDALWGIVGADRKCEDVEAWSDALGGFDALALVDLEQTVSPAALLRLGIPVARIDGRPASPAAWAELLTARVAA